MFAFMRTILTVGVTFPPAMISDDDERLFRLLVAAAADTVESLSEVSLRYVLEDAGGDGVLKPFANWLTRERPDMTSAIKTLVKEIESATI